MNQDANCAGGLASAKGRPKRPSKTYRVTKPLEQPASALGKLLRRQFGKTFSESRERHTLRYRNEFPNRRSGSQTGRLLREQCITRRKEAPGLPIRH